jgi:hypothetical protein
MIAGLLVPQRGSVSHCKSTPRFHTITPSWVLHSNFGCCIGTRSKSATYKISGAAERREVPICELVENKDRRLKEKNGTRRTSRHPHQREKLPSALAAVKGQAR